MPLLSAVTDPRIERWLPVFPACAEPQNTLTNTMECISVTNEGQFEIAEMNDSLVLKYINPLPLYGKTHVRALGDSELIAVDSSDKTLVLANTETIILLLLKVSGGATSPTVADSASSPQGAEIMPEYIDPCICGRLGSEVERETLEPG